MSLIKKEKHNWAMKNCIKQVKDFASLTEVKSAFSPIKND